MLINCIFVGLGGFLGACGRYWMGSIPFYQSMPFPIGTLIINLIGAFFIGCIAGAVPLGWISTKQQLFLQTGFCGGFTTFSTFSLETLTLLDQGRWGTAGIYICFSVCLCLFGVWCGRFFVECIG